MRALIPASAATVALAASVLFAPAALAHNAPGDNGNVKIHDAKTGEELHRNEPHVCTFYLDGFRFDGAQKAEWHIERWAPTDGDKGETVKSGSLTLDGSGHERTEDLALPDGHYKLFWNFDGEHGRAKHKVFWVDCTDSGGGNGGTGTPTPGSGSPSASQSPSGSASPSASAPGGGEQPGGSASATAAPSATDTAAAGSGGSGGSSGSESGGLAETGAQVGGITLGALLLVGAGAVLVTRRRKGAGQH
ncbi:LPXTG cell wall anchor domain-containing protein [Actinacidiphila glaucinigra]|uniref:LPXTG cell wall anchor domain-containing protein n=1 Tax=Actinacidiphila glaucinigra TaxID=235986 RepID=UPI00386E70C2